MFGHRRCKLCCVGLTAFVSHIYSDCILLSEVEFLDSIRAERLNSNMPGLSVDILKSGTRVKKMDLKPQNSQAVFCNFFNQLKKKQKKQKT